MIYSMTAFARAQKQIGNSTFCWEIRSVNHRYLDASFRLPEPFRMLEPKLRQVFRDSIFRGKIECQLKFQDNNAQNQSMLINMGMVNALIGASSELASTHQLPNDLGVSQVLAWPGVIQASEYNMDDVGQDLIDLFSEVVAQLCTARAIEGNALKEHVDGRLQSLSKEVLKAKSLVTQMAPVTKDKLLTRLHTVQLEVSEARVEQEIAMILARLDVMEELDRLHTHIDEVRRALNKERSPGRRLDFLMQELNREANTLSSKSDSVDLTQSAIEMKVLIEQMREQIQNIE